MPSKGVDYYSFIATDSTSIVFAGPKVGSTTTSANNFQKNHLEIDSHNLPWNTFIGTFAWKILLDGGSLFLREQQIDSLTGNLDKGDLTPLMSTPAVIGPNYTISYGLYDSGSGIAGLPNADQAWVTIVPNLADWMGEVAPDNSAQANQAFAQYVLAAAHDAGMNTMDGINVVTNNKTILDAFIAIISVLLPIPTFALLLATNPQKIMLDLAMTQKETTTSMLDMGVRYFDFRPAYLAPGVRTLVPPSDNTLYHTHLVVPGQRFDSFLSEIVAFLQAHPTEIVVIRTSADGIKVCEIPSPGLITSYAGSALRGSGIQLGDNNCFQQSIASLRSSNTRLILVQNNPKYDSYSPGAYATLNPSTIIDQFDNMDSKGQQGNDFTVLQCQGTSEAITDVLIYAATAANWSTSPLMATKASFDIQTLPWILSKALSNLQEPQNIIIMNDFIDGATTYTAYQLSSTRFAQPTQVDGLAIQAKPITVNEQAIEEAGALKETEEARLTDQKANEALLQAITVAHQFILAEKADVSDEDKRVQIVLEAIQKEAEDVRKKQQEVVDLAEKYLQSLKPGQQ